MIGIDFGAKKAGTTAIAFLEGKTIRVFQTSKGFDADMVLRKKIDELKPRHVFIDAPLSLPGVYTGIKGSNDYFYRSCDKETGAMSPMFLGGLTARAMKLRANYPGIEFHESYPGGFMRNLYPDFLKYKKDKNLIAEHLQKILTNYDLNVEEQVVSWHQFDAIICLVIGLRYHSGQAEEIGKRKEGIIYY